MKAAVLVRNSSGSRGHAHCAQPASRRLVFIRRDLGTQAIEKFPAQAGITRFGKLEETADQMSYRVSPAAK
jgi:hypothetical protein